MKQISAASVNRDERKLKPPTNFLMSGASVEVIREVDSSENNTEKVLAQEKKLYYYEVVEDI